MKAIKHHYVIRFLLNYFSEYKGLRCIRMRLQGYRCGRMCLEGAPLYTLISKSTPQYGVVLGLLPVNGDGVS